MGNLLYERETTFEKIPVHMASFSYTYITSTSILEQGDHIFEEKLTSGLSVVLSLSKKEEFLALGQQDGTNLFSFAFLTHISNISAWFNKSRR